MRYDLHYATGAWHAQLWQKFALSGCFLACLIVISDKTDTLAKPIFLNYKLTYLKISKQP